MTPETLFNSLIFDPDESTFPSIRPAMANPINHIQETKIVAKVNAHFSVPMY